MGAQPVISNTLEPTAGADAGARSSERDSPHQPLPFSVFSTENWAGDDRFAAWRESIGVIFDVQPSRRNPPPDFEASVRAYNTGSLLVSAVDFGGQRFSRSVRRIAADGIDHLLVQLYERGGFIGFADRKDLRVNAGDIQILDLGRPHSSITADSGTFAIIAPRDALMELLPGSPDVHGIVIPGTRGLGAVLSDFMKSLYSRLRSVDASEGPIVEQATMELIAACFYPSANTAERARPQIEGVIMDRIARFVRENPGSRDLTPDGLCARFHVSRTQLYQMFERHGGVARYVQQQRLERAFSDLRNPLRRHLRIFEIAFALGFASEAHFSRAFRREFGITPSEARHDESAAAEGHATFKRVNASPYEEWIKRLARR